MATKCLILTSPGAKSGTGGIKVENYVGIEFVRGASDGGSSKGYNRMLGDEELVSKLAFFDLIKLALVNNGRIKTNLKQTNIYKTESGATVDPSGADGSDVMQTFGNAEKCFYLINGGTDPTYERFIVSDSYFEFGDDKAEKVVPFGESADYEVKVNNLSRCILSNNPGSMGTTKCTSITDGLYANANGYPSTQTSRYGYEAAARNKNTNKLSNKPYCNATTLDLEVMLALIYIECRTKIITSVFGHGISSNVMPSETNWASTSGFRNTDGTKHYLTFNNDVYINKQKVNIWTALNGQFPLLQVLQVHKEVANGATLEPVYNADGQALAGAGSGILTGIFKKTITFKLTCAFTSTDADAEHTFELHLCQPVWRGRILNYGNTWDHRSGYEVLNYQEGGKTINILYRAPSIDAITTDSDEVTKTSKGGFSFEKAYDQVCDLGTSGGWVKDTINHKGISLAVCKTFGGGISNYNQAVLYIDNTSEEGKYKRKQAGLFGGSALNGYCVLRFCNASSAPSISNAHIGSRFRVDLIA